MEKIILILALHLCRFNADSSRSYKSHNTLVILIILFKSLSKTVLSKQVYFSAEIISNSTKRRSSYVEIKALLTIFLSCYGNVFEHLTHRQRKWSWRLEAGGEWGASTACFQSCKEYSGQKVQAGIKPNPLGFPSRWDKDGHLQVLIMGWVRPVGRKKKNFSTLNSVMRRVP